MRLSTHSRKRRRALTSLRCFAECTLVRRFEALSAKSSRCQTEAVATSIERFLLALKSDPPTLGFPWNDLSRRVQSVCRPDAPQAASLSTACTQIAKMAREMYPTQRVLDWEGDPANLLSIEDPYFFFYLRWSDKLTMLGRSATESA